MVLSLLSGDLADVREVAVFNPPRHSAISRYLSFTIRQSKRRSLSSVGNTFPSAQFFSFRNKKLPAAKSTEPIKSRRKVFICLSQSHTQNMGEGRLCLVLIFFYFFFLVLFWKENGLSTRYIHKRRRSRKRIRQEHPDKQAACHRASFEC